MACAEVHADRQGQWKSAVRARCDFATGIARVAERPLPPLWKEFDALARVPVMVVRGANSDILSQATVEAMRERRNRMDVVEVADEGHAPRVSEPPTVSRIAEFIAACDSAAR